MDAKYVGFVVLGLLTVGAALGRSSIEPVVVNEQDTKTIIREVEVPGPTQTVYQNRVPEECLDMIRLGLEMNKRTTASLNLITPMLDALAVGRQAIIISDSGKITEADNQLRDLASRSLNSLPPADLGGNPMIEAEKDCEAAVNDTQH